MGVGGQYHAPGALAPGWTKYPLYRRLGLIPGLVWMGVENLGPLGFDPWIVYPVVRHHTNSAILAHMFIYIYIYFFFL